MEVEVNRKQGSKVLRLKLQVDLQVGYRRLCGKGEVFMSGLNKVREVCFGRHLLYRSLDKQGRMGRVFRVEPKESNSFGGAKGVKIPGRDISGMVREGFGSKGRSGQKTSAGIFGETLHDQSHKGSQ